MVTVLPLEKSAAGSAAAGTARRMIQSENRKASQSRHLGFSRDPRAYRFSR
jgi:hypothetical protein